MKVVTVVGARPQFVKAAVVSRQFATRPDCQEILVHTGQHYDSNMSDVFFDELGIPKPDFNLGVGSGSHGRQTAQILEGVEQVLVDTQPDWMLVYGDTNSTLAAALAAVKLQIRVAHIEAGLRSFNRAMPEEINRVLTDHAADLLLAPTETAVRHLQAEGLPADKIRWVGDVMFDATRFFGVRAEDQSRILRRLRLTSQPFVLATVHRAENTDDPTRLVSIVDALCDLAERLPVVLPLHPRTRAALQRLELLERVQASLRPIEPVGYLDMLCLLRAAELVATDSGGVQKEAFFCETPCVTLRDETEWVELVELGWNELVSPAGGSDAVRQSLMTALSRPAPSVTAAAPYGEGNAGEKILAALQEVDSGGFVRGGAIAAEAA